MKACRREIIGFGLALALAVLCASPAAQAAFPGKSGPLVYPRVNIDEAADTGGLLLHGPRQRQKPRRLTSNPTDEAPSFSADGKLVTFSSRVEPPGAGAGKHIFVVSVDGTGLRQLTKGSTNDSEPVFSPDGARIAYLAVGRYSSDLEVMRADGPGGVKEFSDGNTEEEGLGIKVGAPAWGVRP